MWQGHPRVLSFQKAFEKVVTRVPRFDSQRENQTTQAAEADTKLADDLASA